ncbi:ParA family protein [Capnocytophaga canis]|uniref:ParA family protein n=1 Tax=Capnocytophaga canis TaxID=1848903 RepID=UPI001562451A|nr:ParA family protein [Capnocytophaga canis]
MIIVNLNKKGGVGKTTNTIHIASYLASKKKKVLLIDADNQCDLSWSNGVADCDAVFNIVDFLSDNSEKEADFKISQENLYLLPGSQNFEASLYDRFALQKKIKQYNIHSFFDFVFIDVPPAGINSYVVTPAEMALCASDAFLCTIKADMYSVNNLNSFLGNVFKLQDKYDLGLKFLGVYFSDVNEHKIIFKKFRDMIEEQAGDVLLKTYIRSDAEVEKAAVVGQTIFQFNPSCRAAQDYKDLTNEILKKIKNNG